MVPPGRGPPPAPTSSDCTSRRPPWRSRVVVPAVCWSCLLSFRETRRLGQLCTPLKELWDIVRQFRSRVRIPHAPLSPQGVAAVHVETERARAKRILDRVNDLGSEENRLASADLSAVDFLKRVGR